MRNPRASWRQQINFLLTAIGMRQKGFYSPYDYISAVRDIGSQYPHVDQILREKTETFRSFLREIDANEDHFLDSASGAGALDWDTRWISKLDGATIYTAVNLFRPSAIVEIGSGNSTAFLSRAISDHKLEARVTCIDPVPRADISKLDVRFLRRLFGIDDLRVLEYLKAGDILFIDSSHILQQDFDVDILFNRGFPSLAPGVIVHVHDVFLPFPYPESWQPYRFNEQNALIPWLLSGFFDVEFASHFVWRCMTAELDEICQNFPLNTPENGGSIWLRKT